MVSPREACAITSGRPRADKPNVKQLWLATGQDGQIFKIDWDGNVLGAIGNGPGNGDGQFTESTYMAMDAQGNLYAGDTGRARVTKMTAVAK